MYSLTRAIISFPRVTISAGVTPIRVAASDAQPGVMLFRKAADTLSLVYLVGEIPTAGVHVAALNAALEERWTLLGRYGGPPVDERGFHPVRVLGPSFSGSSTSPRSKS